MNFSPAVLVQARSIFYPGNKWHLYHRPLRHTPAQPHSVLLSSLLILGLIHYGPREELKSMKEGSRAKREQEKLGKKLVSL